MISSRKDQLSILTKQPHLSKKNKDVVVKMILESTEVEPNMQELRDGLQQTFAERREWMERDPPYINALIRTFPALTFPEMLEFEFESLTKTKLTTLKEKLAPRLELIFNSPSRVRCSIRRFPLCRRSYEILDHSKLDVNSDEYLDLRRSVALLFLWHELVPKIKYGEVYRFLNIRDDIADEIGESKVKGRKLPPGPYILILNGKLVDEKAKHRMVMFAEHNEIVRSNSFFESMMFLYIIYSVFLLEYVPSIEGLFTNFDEILGIGAQDKFTCPPAPPMI